MNKLIVIVGASGVGKTSLAQALCKHGNFLTAYEEHDGRPFQALFKQDVKYAFANQMDYLLLRAEQESVLRGISRLGIATKNAIPPRDGKIALMDGGLDLDFHCFTRLFKDKGWLSEAKYGVCKRFYKFTRKVLPLPDLIVALSATQETVSQRLAVRNRINIASESDAQALESYMLEWLETIPEEKILKLDVTNEDAEYYSSVTRILEKI